MRLAILIQYDIIFLPVALVFSSNSTIKSSQFWILIGLNL